MQNNSKKIKNKGFTLIEALVAITILTVSIVGPITIASKSISSAMFARDQITAFYLAQEAVEFIRNKRDENNIRNRGWLRGLNKCSGNSPSPCTIDVRTNKIKNCDEHGNTCPLLKYHSSSGLYSYSGDETIFTRTVKMTTINSNEELITVTMSWRTGIIQKTFVVKEYIFHW